MDRKFCILVLLMALYSCGRLEPKTIGVYVFIDVTNGAFDSKKSSENDIYQILDFADISPDNGGDNGVELRFFQINDLSEGHSQTIVLKEGIPGMLGKNPLDRTDEINAFINRIKENLEGIKKSNQEELPHSKIYQNLCRELGGLDFKHERNLIVIYSDMLENSDLFSFYKDRTKIKKWEEDIDIAMDFLEQEDCSFPKFNNVDMYIISERNKHTDEMINEAQNFWKAFFSQKGTVPHFDSELNLYK